jgi:hypothetical protein
VIRFDTVSATGHRRLTRVQRAWVEPELYRVARKLRDEHDVQTAVTGMALLVDQIWAEAVLAVGLMRLHAVVPFPGQADRWSAAEKARWASILQRADVVTVVSEEDPADGPEASRMLERRNLKMLVISDVVVAVWHPDRRRGGTWNALNAATCRGLPVVWLNPVAEATTMPTTERWRRILQRGKR